ncbi:hypothetical protein DLM77_21200 [Leptospira yasudae]|uniref:Uncharacterized protein n=1 Tax=Leptospira yasudae TaxID=2202201 RepID=A0ABX9LXX4_9LEPT|nr:hypothetical protein DLM77_21200 [Leptospira yasudae]
MTLDEFELKSFGIFKKTIDQYRDNYSRQDGAYSLFNKQEYHKLIKDCIETNQGAYKLLTPQDRTGYFLLALQHGNVDSIMYPIFNQLILRNHLNEIIYALLILFMDFQMIHSSSRKNFLKSLLQ